MYVFGINLPIGEMLFILLFIFIICLIIVLLHLIKLEKMTGEEKDELKELEKMAQEEKNELDQIANIEYLEKKDLNEFNTDIQLLKEDKSKKSPLKKEENTRNQNTQKSEHDFIPDLYKLQNYVLIAMRSGKTKDQIKEALLKKGWKDDKMLNMILDDASRYTDYYKNNKKNTYSTIKIEERTKIIDPTPNSKPTSKPTVSKTKKSSIDKEIDQLEADIKKEKKMLEKTIKKNKKTPKKKNTKTKTVNSSIKKSAPKSSKKTTSTSTKSLVVGTKTGKSFHRPSCIVMKNIKKKNVVTFKNKNEAIKKGYKPCTVCFMKTS